MILEQEKNPPTFQLIPQRITNKEKNATTRGYTVQCTRKDIKQMTHLMTHGSFRDTPLFIPFKYKATQSDLFTKCIRQQNEVYYNTWIIKLEGITEEALQYIQEDIAQMPGVYYIVPTKKMTETGEWKILVNQNKCAYVHRQLTTNWNMIISKIPAEVMERAPDTCSAPRVSSKKVREYQDTASDNDSYGSLLTTGTEVSIMTNDDETLNELPTEYQYPSYASAAAGASNVSDNSAQMSSPTVSTQSEWQKEKAELEALIHQQAQQIERIEADLQTKISRSQDLEDKLAQAIELAHTRDERHEEMLKKFEALLGKYSSEHTGDMDEEDPKLYVASEAKTPPRKMINKVTSPPQKKANTNMSPQRHLYALFRPPGRPLRMPNNQQQNSPQKLLTQPMETDDDTIPQKPGVEPGKKYE